MAEKKNKRNVGDAFHQPGAWDAMNQPCKTIEDGVYTIALSTLYCLLLLVFMFTLLLHQVPSPPVRVFLGSNGSHLFKAQILPRSYFRNQISALNSLMNKGQPLKSR